MLKYIKTETCIAAFISSLVHKDKAQSMCQVTGEEATGAGFLHIGETDGEMSFSGKSVSMWLGSDSEDVQLFGDRAIVVWNNWQDFMIINQAFYDKLVAGSVVFAHKVEVKVENGMISDINSLPAKVKGWIHTCL